MLVRILSSIGVVLALSACQTAPKNTPIPDNVLDSLSSQWVIANACYNAGDYSVDKAVSYREAIRYALSTWTVDSTKLEKMVNDKQTRLAEHQTNNGLGSICQDWLLNFETTVTNANNHKQQANLTQQRQHEIDKARASAPSSVSYGSSSTGTGNNGIQCTRLGDISFNKNIQTFNGSVCPIGWLPYYGW
ncbi:MULTISPECIES: hypothetical protein [Vibrio]|uniref:hypothetical protein n=1 Tax=Vibrio TaxID=662 RepID=UPI0020954B77|nr:hypothetical protein [Vibrio paracholerae]ELJ8545979.1 hypothetical protein [Vibrio cholerae]ELJ8750021.1 hypothetical protein [Vibrio cholerae]MCO7066789.1 hypothetical protein [Vibrio paracholerae]HDB1444086.1 hypothetical protein [Vibrio cholerae]